MREALTYPSRGSHAEKALLSAWLCVLVHAIVLPFVALVPLLGYAATILADGRDAEPPAFLERAVGRRSVGATAVTIGYGLVPVGTAVATFALLVEGDQPPAGGDAIFVLLASTAVLSLLAGYAYVLPIALANYVRADSLRAAASGLLGVASHAAYFVGWASGIALLLVGFAVASSLAELGALGTVAGSFVGAYAVLAACRRLARGYAAAVD